MTTETLNAEQSAEKLDEALLADPAPRYAYVEARDILLAALPTREAP